MVNINGRLLDKEHAVISVFDHGFLYGEGIYEVVRTYDGVPLSLIHISEPTRPY